MKEEMQLITREDKMVTLIYKEQCITIAPANLFKILLDYLDKCEGVEVKFSTRKHD